VGNRKWGKKGVSRYSSVWIHFPAETQLSPANSGTFKGIKALEEKSETKWLKKGLRLTISRNAGEKIILGKIQE